MVGFARCKHERLDWTHHLAALGTDMLNRRFSKTEAGRLEIQARAMPLARSSRNLLLIIDSSRTAAEWIGIVQGCDLAALQALQDAGLVSDTNTDSAGNSGVSQSPDADAVTTLASAAATSQHMDVAQALENCSYSSLYDRITAEARPRLGLIKGYKMIMALEQCSNATEVRTLALHFIEQERDLHGEAAGKALMQLLIAPQ